MHLHPDLDENGNDPCILTNGAMAHSTHSGIDENLRHCIFRGRVLLHLPGAMDSLNKIKRVVIRNKLQGVGDTINQILLFDHCLLAH